jgi:hypothetical protein
MKKILVLAGLMAMFATVSISQEPADIERVVRNIADRILDHSTYRIINEKTGETFEVASEASGKVSDLELESPYNDWKYWNGVLNLAFDELTLALDDEKYGFFFREEHPVRIRQRGILQKALHRTGPVGLSFRTYVRTPKAG